jgi:hypothetical protein
MALYESVASMDVANLVASKEGEGLTGSKRPLLERGAATGFIASDDPQVAVLVLDRVAIPHVHPDNSRVALDGNDVVVHREDLIMARAFSLPET